MSNTTETVTYRVETFNGKTWRKTIQLRALRTEEAAKAEAAGYRNIGETVRIVRNVTVVSATATVIDF